MTARPVNGPPPTVGLLWGASGAFATGACAFENRAVHAGDGLHRVFLPLAINGVPLEAVVDTGGAFLILEPDLAGACGLDVAGAFAPQIVAIRGERRRGHLLRSDVTLVADDGQDLTLDVTVFVPTLPPGDVWPLPPYLGWQGALERLRLAVDPAVERVYFGAC